MTLQLRFALLIVTLFAALLGGLWLHDQLNKSDTGRLRANLQQEREALVGRLVELTGEPVRVFAADYAPWDEMVNFVHHPEPDWARNNIIVGMDTHHLDAAWVLRPDFSEVYGTVRADLAALRPFPLNPDMLRGLMAGSGELHCFIHTGAGLLEMRGAPIRPSDLQAVIPAPYGWLFAGRLWNDGYLRQLEELLGGKVELATGANPAALPTVVATALPLADWQGRTVRELRTAFVAPALVRADDDARSDLVTLAAFGLTALLAFAVATHLWVVRPLRHLGASLQQRSPAPLGGLLRAGGEFGALSRLVEESFAQEKYLRQIYTAFNAIDDAVFITDTTRGDIIHVNLGATRLLGQTAAELQGRTLDSLKAAPPGTPAEGIWLRCHDGRLVEIEAREQALPGDGARQLSVTVARDISDRRRLEHQRQRAQRLVSLGTLAGGVAHDMNNMLTPIVFILDELAESGRVPSPTLLASVRKSVKRGATILRQLLTFGRGFEGARMPLDLGQLIEEIGQIVTSTFPKSITFETHVARNLPAVQGDTTQLHQVLLNLCMNARDAMPQGGSLTVSAAPFLLADSDAAIWPDAKPGSYVLLDVTDNGTGMAPEILDRIFDPFFSTKSADQGSGLGLSITLGIVRGHGGSIRVRSESGRGSCFSVLLPIAATAVSIFNFTEQAKDFDGGGRTVLVIDDEASIRNVLQRSLERMAFKVVTAGNGQDGLTLYDRNPAGFSLIITDLSMPGLDGIAVLRAARAVAPALPVILISGRVDEVTLAALNQHGLSGLLHKPFDYGQILEAVRKVLG